MRICIVTPVRVDSNRGNGVTARRWQGLLQELGHEVRIQSGGVVDGECDLLIALHARRSAESVRAFGASHPEGARIVAMTGTDLYLDLPGDPDALASIAAADRVVVLQELGIFALPEDARDKARVVWQSVTDAPERVEPPVDRLLVCVLGHLREVKDPLCAARALAHVPPDFPIEVVLAGSADDSWERAARAAAEDRRFRWIGELGAGPARELLARSHVLVVSSRQEGGANVVSEAIAIGVPVFASRMDGNVGMLGSDYGGYFPVGDDVALAALFRRAREDSRFLPELTRAILTLQPRVAPAAEKAALAALLAEF